YWGFWDPSWLLFGSPGPLLWWSAPLIAVGVYRCRTKVDRTAGVLLIGTTLIVPLAGCTFGAPHYIASAAAILPLLALASGVGGEHIAALVERAMRRPPADTAASIAASGEFSG
ncbi:MAG: hypothetical protein ABI039_00585, partial [Vicinamibacterales bacterium]